MNYYTREQAREIYEQLKDWTDEDFDRAESNWEDMIETVWEPNPYNECQGTKEDYESAQEPYGEDFLDWCCSE